MEGFGNVLVAECKKHLLAVLRFDFPENKKYEFFLLALSDCAVDGSRCISL